MKTRVLGVFICISILQGFYCLDFQEGFYTSDNEYVLDMFDSTSNPDHLVILTLTETTSRLYLLRIDKTAKPNETQVVFRHEIDPFDHRFAIGYPIRGACMHSQQGVIYVTGRYFAAQNPINFILKIDEKNGSLEEEWRDFEIDIWRDRGSRTNCDPQSRAISCTATAIYASGKCEYAQQNQPNFFDKSDAYAFKVDIDPNNGNPSLAWTIYDDSSPGSEEYYSILGDDDIDSVFISGLSGWALGSQTNGGGTDGIVIKADASTGQELWRELYATVSDVACSRIWLNPEKSKLYMAGETEFAFNKMPEVLERHVLLGVHDVMSGKRQFVQNLGGDGDTLVRQIDVDWDLNLVYIVATTSSSLQGVKGYSIPQLLIFNATSMNLLGYKAYPQLDYSRPTTIRKIGDDVLIAISEDIFLQSSNRNNNIRIFSTDIYHSCDDEDEHEGDESCLCDPLNSDVICMQSNDPCLPDSCHQGICFNDFVHPDSFSCYCPEDLAPEAATMDNTCFFEVPSVSATALETTTSPVVQPETTIQASSNNSDVIIYIGAGVGGGLMILIIILVLVVMCYRCRVNARMQPKLRSNQEFGILQALVSPGFDRTQLRLGAWIGEGAFAQVVEASYKGHNVAVKTLRPDTTSKDLLDFEAEISLLSRINIFGGHKHVIRMIGYDVSMDPGVLVMEFMARGSLLSLLRHSAPTRSSGSCASTIFSEQRQIRMLLDCARGLNFLSRHKLVHRDVAARNVLVDRDYICKLTDFGLARDIYTDNIYTSSGVGLLPFKWMALECIQSHVYNTATDVWSFGVLMWEVFTFGTTPYSSVQNDELLDYLLQGNRLEQPDNCPDAMHNLMMLCWDELPNNRPSFDQIEQKMMKMVEDMKRVSKSTQNSKTTTVAEYVVMGIDDIHVPPPLIVSKQQDLPGGVDDDDYNDESSSSSEPSMEPYSDNIIAPKQHISNTDNKKPYETFVRKPLDEDIQLEEKYLTTLQDEMDVHLQNSSV